MAETIEETVAAEETPSTAPLCLCEQYVRVTEGAALTAARWLGRADQEAAERDAGDPRARGSIDLLKPMGENVQAIAEAFGRRPNDITTIVLDRPRHHDLIEDIRASGARIKLIQDGTVTASISAAIRGTNDHLAVGIGGTRQAVMSAAAPRCLGGALQAQLRPPSPPRVQQAREAGLHVPARGCIT